MKKISIHSVLMFWILLFSFQNLRAEISENKIALSFKENKGQVGDQHSKPRPDVLFTGNVGQLNFYLRTTGISYQMYRVDTWVKNRDEFEKRLRRSFDSMPDQTTIYRLDMNWINANSNAQILKEHMNMGYDNYYNEVCPNGVTGVKSYKNITYQNLYKGIDLKWYEKDGNLKYDYIIAPGVDHKQIQIDMQGAESISISTSGELVIKTPLGTLIEKAPYVTQEGKALKAKWKINGSLVYFDIANVDPKRKLVIDPLIRLWGTYYGDNAQDGFSNTAIDASGNVYAAGSTLSLNNIASSGAHQITYGGWGGASGDAMLIKFNSAGVRLWGTYYGGTGNDGASFCALNVSGNKIAFCGTTTSTLLGVIATPGAHQTNYAGTDQVNVGDAFLVLFDDAGIRQWATYYGGSGGDWSGGCSFDALGNIYMAGQTSTTVNATFATPGCHQSANAGGYADAFIVKFNGNGTRLWGTYYGGNGHDWGATYTVDASGYGYLVGASTSTTSGIATPGAFQQVYGGASVVYGDAYIAKFDANGVRQWGTYYGGVGDDYANNCVIDASGNIYLAGSTTFSSQSVIATAGAHQSVYGGGSSDLFLLKLNSSGERQWCTFYGGPSTEAFPFCAIDPIGNIYISGITNSIEGISTPCSYQQNYGGSVSDAFLVKFTALGERLWGTYYGAFGYEDWPSCTCDALGNIYVTGYTSTQTSSVMTSAGAHQTMHGGGGFDGFIVKFDGCIPTLPPNTTDPSHLNICNANSTTLTTNPTCNLKWYDVASGGTPIGTDSLFATPELTTTTTFYVSEGSCGSNTVRTAITVTVNTPSISISVDPKILCYKTSLNASVSGALSYTWFPDKWISCTNCYDPVLSPLETVEYCVEGMDNNSCIGKACTTIEVNLTRNHDFSLPNAFTPNGDGINDSFCLKGWDVCNAEFKIQIYDRWGEKVFESSDPNFCWNGVFKGQLLSSDVFVCSVSAKYKDETEVNKKGNITLIR